MLNKKGIRFIAERTTEMHIDTVEKAAKAIARQLDERARRIAKGRPLDTDNDLVAVGRHIAWIIGFDHLIDDRKAIGQLVDKLDA